MLFELLSMKVFTKLPTVTHWFLFLNKDTQGDNHLFSMKTKSFSFINFTL